MAELVPDNVDSLRETLDEFFHGVAKFSIDQGALPATDSQFSSEQAEFPRPETIVTGPAIASQLIESSGEHISAFIKTITKPIEPIACWTCVRSILESSAIAAWLLDPSINAYTRVGRIFALRYEGLEQQRKFVRAIDPSGEAPEEMKERIDCIEQHALDLGYTKVNNKKGRRIGIGQKMPSSTDIIKLMLDEEVMYRLLSAVAHGHTWAITLLAFKVVSQTGDPHMGAVPIHTLEKKLDARSLAELGLCAAKAFARPVWHHCCYFGWDKAKLAMLLDTVFDNLQVERVARFWREPLS